MSASSKKKLRNAQDAAKMTEKQLAEQKEAKKLKLYTTIFVVVLALMVCFAVYTGVSKTIEGSGIRERNTAALTIGEHEISNAELNYYFMDSVNNFYSQYGSYATLFGLDTTKPLDEQVADPETGATWADDFMNAATSNIRAVYALNDAAAAAGFALSEADLANVEANIENMKSYATTIGYPNFNNYLKAVYGHGANEEGFRDYTMKSVIAQAYQAEYAAQLTYDDAAIATESEANTKEYSAYTYNYYYLSTSRFLEGGTTDSEGAVTYSDEEKAASVKAAEKAALELAAGKYASIEEFNAAIAAMPINADTENATSYAYTDAAYSSITAAFQEWVTANDRKAGDVTSLPYTSTDSDGNETVSGYYVVYFVDSNDNNYPLVNVRHILAAFEGGSYDSATGTTTYSDAEKANAKEAAEALLASWKSGEATEESFAALANAESDDGNGTTGGLYEDVYPGEMVTNFNNWCFEDGRQPGDTGIVETEYGYHVMYFSGYSETLYREFLIESSLRSADAAEWYNALVEATKVTNLDTKYIRTDLSLSGM